MPPINGLPSWAFSRRIFPGREFARFESLRRLPQSGHARHSSVADFGWYLINTYLVTVAVGAV